MAKKQTTDDKPRTWRDVVAVRQPDLNLDDDLAVADYLGRAFDEADRMGRERQQLNDLLTTDPQAAGILTGLSSGVGDDGQPFSLVAYLLDNYYDEIQDSTSKEEAIERARKREAENIRRAADEEKRRKQAAEALKASDEALTGAMTDANADEAAVAVMLAWLYGEADKEDGFIYRIVRNEVSKEDWTRLLHAFSRDKDLEAARREGARETRARRGNPQRSLRDVPSDLGGGASMDGGGAAEEDPTLTRYRRMKRRFN